MLHVYIVTNASQLNIFQQKRNISYFFSEQNDINILIVLPFKQVWCPTITRLSLLIQRHMGYILITVGRTDRQTVTLPAILL